MGVAHAHKRFVDIDTLSPQPTVFIAVHHVVVGLLGIEVLRTRFVRGERSNAVGQSFLNEVVAEIHVILLSYSRSNIYWTNPVTLCNHL